MIFEKYGKNSFLGYFERISAIPRVSGHTGEISDFICRFAKEQGLNYRRDQLNNVIIRKPGQNCRSDAPWVILQGHMDMVGDKRTDSDHDFLRDPLSLILDGDQLMADGTTLGGDDGIAVAMMLSVLSDHQISCPPLEAVFTADEEIGLLGAEGLDMSSLQGRIMINIDSEDEGVITAGCAGGMTASTHLPVTRTPACGSLAEIQIDGLKGGHSGQMIQTGRANAIKLMGRLLSEFSDELSYQLVDLEGGQKDNVIPFYARAALLLPDEEAVRTLEALIEEKNKTYLRELTGADDDLRISVKPLEKSEVMALTEESRERILTQLLLLPYGVMSMDRAIPGLVETSSNVGVMKLSEHELLTISSLRSSVLSKRDYLARVMEKTAKALGGTMIISGAYPAWEFREKSPLRELMTDIWKEMTGKQPRVEVIHAGLECGLFYDRLPGLDAVSIGPDLKDIHTFSERLSVSSAIRTDEYLRRILERLAG